MVVRVSLVRVSFCLGSGADEMTKTVTAGKVPLTIDWARQWNAEVLRDNQVEHLAVENF